MKPRERVQAVLESAEPDRVPLFEVWIDNEELVERVGNGNVQRTYAELGLDCLPIPSHGLPGSNAWGDGVDEWGRIWKKGWYAGGVVETEADLDKYSPPLEFVDLCFDVSAARVAKEEYPDHYFFYGSHIAPFISSYLATGMERFFRDIHKRPTFVHKLLKNRTEWCIAMFQKAVSLGAELLVLGEDAAYKHGPMISPQLWRELVVPYHRRIVDEAGVPVIWHSDGNLQLLLPLATEAGFAGVHSLEPAAGVDLKHVKQEFGRDLVLVGNVDAAVLCGADVEAVRAEVRRCMDEGAPGGGYMFSTCNSVFSGMNLDLVVEMYRYAAELGTE